MRRRAAGFAIAYEPWGHRHRQGGNRPHGDGQSPSSAAGRRPVRRRPRRVAPHPLWRQRDADNIAEFIAGLTSMALVGGACLKAESFASIVEQAARISATK
jgi:hypothetical protein